MQKLSIFISLILRHKPEVIGISLNEHGWADVNELLEGINRSGKYTIDMHILEEIVRTDNKQRYSFNEDKTMIRANLGHSIPVDVELEEAIPPEYLYHGTGTRSVPSIREQGLLHGKRLYVHLSKDMETAQIVGKRHGEPHIFRVYSGEMQRQGFVFYLSKNGVWLTKHVPPQFLEDFTE